MNIKAKKIASAIAVTAALSTFVYTPYNVAAMNYIGSYGDYFNQSSNCIVSVNAYCVTNNQYLDKAPIKIKDSYGRYLSFSYFGGSYSIVQSGGSELLYTDETGGITLDIPPGQYTIVAESANGYTISNTQVPFTIANGSTSQNVDVEYKLESGSLTVSCSTSEGDSLSGCSIQISDAFGNPVNFFAAGNNYTYKTSSGKTLIPINDNSITVSGFPAGTYYITVPECPSGMEPVMDNYPFTINNGDSISINIEMSVVKSGQLSISNIDASGNIVTGSACSIVGPDNTILTFTKDGNSTYKYDVNGLLNTIPFESEDPIFITGLPTGTEYTVNEVNTSAGYVLADPQKIQIDNDETKQVILTAKKTTGALTITVSDDVTNEKVEDFTYTITSAQSKTPMYFSLKDAGQNSINTQPVYVYNENGEITAVKTSSSGVINIEGLPSGDIIIKCKESPVGYVTDTSDITKTITPNSTTLCDFTVSKSNVAIEVIDENESPVIDVSIEIYNSDGKIVMTGQTNAKGKILLTSVAAGSYTYRLAGVPEGFSYTDEIKSFTISPTGIADGLTPIHLEKTKIQVSIGKQEGTNSLENAVFALYDVAGNEISRALTTSSGIATFSGIGYGEYVVKQISAPIGYSVSDKELPISITSTYQNEDVFDFSADDLLSSSETDNQDENVAEKNNKGSNKKSFSVGDIYFLIIFILVIAFVVVAAVSFIIKLKSRPVTNDENNDDNSSPNDNSNDIDREVKEQDPPLKTQAHPIVFNDNIDDDGVKIFTPAAKDFPAPKSELKKTSEESSTPLFLRCSAQPLKPDFETASEDNPILDLEGKSPEELRMMEEQIKAIIANKKKSSSAEKGEPESNERSL